MSHPGRVVPGAVRTVPGRRWRAPTPQRSSAVRELLVRLGAAPDSEVGGPYEVWRVRLGRVVFTGYSTGTIYCAGGSEPELSFVYQKIGELLGDGEGGR